MKQSSNAIALFSLAYAPFEGGAEVALREIIPRLSGFNTTCFTRYFDVSWQREEQLRGVRVIRLGRPSSSYYGHRLKKIGYVFLAWRAAERLHKTKPFTHIWGMMASYGGIAALLFKLRHPEIPFILTLQEGDSERYIVRRVGVLYPLWRMVFKRADRIQVISEYLGAFAEKYGATCPIELIPNGVDIKRFSRTHQESKYNKPVTIITTSRLVYKNGIDTLLYAVKELGSLLPEKEYELIVAGSGPEEKKLKRLSRKLHIEKKVTFLGQIEQKNIPKYLHRADIFVRLSRSEGLGSSFLEAMAADLPVIGTSVGGIPEFLKDKETGLICPPDSYVEAAKAISSLIQNKEMRSRLAGAGNALIKQRYEWNYIAGAIQRMLVRACPRKRILIASGIFPPDIGGAATWTRMVLDSFPKEKFDIAVYTYGSGRKSNTVRFVSRAWPKGIRHIIFFFNVLVGATRANVLIAADSSFAAAGVIASTSLLLQKKYIVRVTGDYAWEQGIQRFGIHDDIDTFQENRYGWQVEWLRSVQRFAVQRASRTIAPSDYLRQMVIGWGVPGSRVVTIYNAVGIPARIGRESARKTLQLSGKLIVSSGRLVPWKGFETLISVVARLRKEFADIKLIIIGDGPDLPRLTQLVQKQNLSRRVIFTGRLPQEVLHHYIEAADIFALDTAYEGLSHQLVEALLFDRPVVTTPVGGNPEIAKYAGGRMHMVPHKDVESFTDTIREVLGQSGRGEKDTIQKVFSEEKMIKHLTRLIENV